MKKGISILLAGMMVLALSACSSKNDSGNDPQTNAPAAETETLAEGEETGGADYSQYTIGCVQPGPEEYYQTFFDRIEEAAKHAGFQVQTLLSEYSTETEMNNVEDLISRGVDAIAIFPLTSDSAQIITQICNEADVPIFIVTTECAEGEGIPTAAIGNSFYDMGYLNGTWLIDNLDQVGGEAKVLELQGALGTGIGDEITRGFEEATKDTASIEIVYQTDCQWDRASAISALEDQISAGTEFNVVFVHNEDMCGGVVSVLEEKGLADKVLVMTQNGSDSGFEMLDAKQIAMTVTNSPSLVAGETVVAMMKYFDGALTDADKDIDAAVYSVDQSNYQNEDTITWDVSWAIDFVDGYLAAK